MDIIKAITPVNLNEENNKFMRCFNIGIKYNPQYEYERINGTKELKERIYGIEFPEDSIGEVYKAYKQYVINSIELIESIGDPDLFTLKSIELFSHPDDDILKRALAILKRDRDEKPEENKVYTAEDLKVVFEKAIDKDNINWKVEILNVMSSKAAVDPDEKKIYINKELRFSENEVRRLFVHEYGTHVLRAENGSKQPYRIFSSGFPHSIETEEGLAIYNEWRNKLLDENMLRLYAGRVIAAESCISNSFYDIYCILSKYFREEDCIRMVSRVKRGLRDTSCKGGFTKDHVYLSGFYKVKVNITPEVKNVLYTGVVGVEDVSTILNLKGIRYF